MGYALLKSEMRAVLVVIAEVFRKQPPQMTFVHCNDMIQQIAPATLDPVLGDAVLLGTLVGGSHRPYF